MLQTIFPSIEAIISLSVIAAAFGLILSIAKIKLKVIKDERINKVLEALPGANCGACGYPGCNGYATRVVTDGVEITLCPVGGEASVKKIAEIMGIANSSDMRPLIARVHCQGGISETVKRFNYAGPLSCAAAQDVMGGFKVCEFGCLGYGDCDAACPFDAIEMNKNGLPVINWHRCTGCGRCVTACPRNIISLTPDNFDMHVLCRNTQKAPQMMKGCSVGCTACQLCVKACKEVFKDNPDVETAIQVIDFLAVIDYDLCINCGKCAEACKKQKVISFGRLNEKK